MSFNSSSALTNSAFHIHTLYCSARSSEERDKIDSVPCIMFTLFANKFSSGWTEWEGSTRSSSQPAYWKLFRRRFTAWLANTHTHMYTCMSRTNIYSYIYISSLILRTNRAWLRKRLILHTFVGFIVYALCGLPENPRRYAPFRIHEKNCS